MQGQDSPVLLVIKDSDGQVRLNCRLFFKDVLKVNGELGDWLVSISL